ncbi:MAG: T9SS type A sorting domain-containing protein, partial [Cryomorphaceae bacterium]
GNVSISVNDGGKLEFMAGSQLALNEIDADASSYGILVHPDAVVYHPGIWKVKSRLVNCGELTTDRLRVASSGELNNNNLLAVEDENAAAIVEGVFTNAASAKITGSMETHPGSKLTNYCEIIVDLDIYILAHVYNHSFIQVGSVTKIESNVNVMMYENAMFETNSLLLGGRFIGDAETSLVKVINISSFAFTGCVEGGVAFCDLDGIEENYNDTPFLFGAEESCAIPMPTDKCNRSGHSPSSKNENKGGDPDGEAAIIEGLAQGMQMINPAAQIGENGILTIWPNPTSGQAAINYLSKAETRILLEIYAVDGKLMTTIFEGGIMKNQTMRFDADLSGLHQGVYFVRILDGDQSMVQKLVLTK